MKIEWKYGYHESSDCFLVRKKVFVDEQGFSQENEFDKIDHISHHLCIYTDDGIPVAAARLFLEDLEQASQADTEKPICYHCGRICVLSSHRGLGIGTLIMNELEKKAVLLNANQLVLSAQVRVKDFYSKLSYIQQGEEYLDEFCPHILMKKRIAQL